jgi:hypothetical protein
MARLMSLTVTFRTNKVKEKILNIFSFSYWLVTENSDYLIGDGAG